MLTEVAQALTDVERTMCDAGRMASPALAVAVSQALSGSAKRMRPYLTLVTSALLGANGGGITVFAASVEVLHTAALVHDDLIDGAALRRGRPSINTVLSPVETVLVGDYMFARAAVLAARALSPRVIELFAEALTSMVESEMSQGRAEAGNLAGRESYLHRIHGKTAILFALATEGAAILSGATEDETAALARFGRDIGMAFQITDDTLDYTATSEAMGKPAFQDLRRGIATMPLYCLAAREPGNAALRGYLARRDHTEDDVTALIAAIVGSPAIAESKTEARTYAENAKEALRGFPDSRFRKELFRCADYAVERDQ
ncbi:MAG: polyprenyl synthetase family protein [Candidatus Eremiobacteraeota bacterium]|nr:polyprenyl synthetase family protein [Candidatus Eremiobacteraeota bacterium]